MDLQIHIPADEQAINPVCNFAYSWCLNCGLSEQEASKFTTAVSELVTDIILFAFPQSENKFVDLTFRQTLSDIELIASEAGEPFDPDKHRYNPENALNNGDFEGAGLRIIRRFTDDFLFINKGKEGKEFRLRKEVNIHDIDELIELSRSLKPKEPEKEPTKVSYSISQITPADAEDIAKLIYRTYEYSYTKEDLYFPKKIEKTLTGKEKLGVITRSDEGEALGYFAILPKEDSNIAEVGEAVVSPDYRKQGIMSNMMEQLIKVGREHNLEALYGKAVTIHPVSQRVNQKFGFTSTGLMLLETNNVVFKGFDEEYPQPVSVVIDVLPLQENDPKDVYLPAKYHQILTETYQRLGISITPKKSNGYKLAEKSDADLEINYSDSTSDIIVNKYGPDFKSVLREMLNSLLEQENPNAIYLDLPLENEATPLQLKELEGLGFIYCGLAPYFHQDADYLRLQKICTSFDFDLVDVHSDFGQQIKSFITNEYSKNS
ncbi:GNAT family N-acetyltransferase [Fodinibius sp.]|uniref:GNAT family N-acetyltransferase n=1 Tax=Fodinibius sp. TaxID=1872440 RepID=UPI002ACD37BE|nr:GNAT family N-acetyltransferase [Fodinibius sp.]MDZ7660024.1 GNAT family N-acetyltransferase [Fodinibius sp.]